MLQGIVADLGHLLVTIDGEESPIQIQDGMPTQGREHCPTILIVQFEKGHPSDPTEAAEKTAQAGSVRISGQPRQVPGHPVARERPREAQPFLAEDDRVEPGQRRLADLIAAVALLLIKPHSPRQLTAQANPNKELVHEEYAAIGGQGVPIERNQQIIRPMPSLFQNFTKVRFWCQRVMPFSVMRYTAIRRV